MGEKGEPNKVKAICLKCAKSKIEDFNY